MSAASAPGPRKKVLISSGPEIFFLFFSFPGPSAAESFPTTKIDSGGSAPAGGTADSGGGGIGCSPDPEITPDCSALSATTPDRTESAPMLAI